MLGQKKGASMVGGLIGIMIVIILLVAAVLPTVQSSLTTANFNGTTKTLTDLIPVFLAIMGLVVVAGYMKFG